MNYLTDTHIFLWVIFSPQKISKTIRNTLLDREATKNVSLITFWEISLKFALKKIDLRGVLPDQLPSIAKDTGFEILNLDPQTVSSFYKLPKLRNKDPFNHMLAWQAIKNNYFLLTQDQGFLDYKEHGLNIV